MPTLPSPLSSRPWLRAWLLWLVTILLGTAVCFPTARHYFYSDTKPELEGLGFLLGACAALGSLPIVPLAARVMPQLLRTTRRSQRLSIVSLVVSGFFGIATLLLFAVFQEGAFVALAYGAWVYWPAALVAALVVYRRLLFFPSIPVEASAPRAS